MTLFTEDDLRAALDADANAGAPPVDVWSRLQRHRRKQQRLRAGLALAGAAAVAATVVIARPGHDDAAVIPPVTSNIATLVPTRPLSTAELEQAVNTFRQRVDALGVNHATISTQGDAVEIQASGTTRADIAAIAVRGLFQVHPVADANAAADGTFDYQLGPAALDNADVDSATAFQDSRTGYWQVEVTFDRQGAREFRTLTAKAANKPDPGNCGPPQGCAVIVIEIDGTVLSDRDGLPPGGLSGRQVQVAGGPGWTKEEAQTLAALVTSAPLPVGFHLTD